MHDNDLDWIEDRLDSFSQKLDIIIRKVDKIMVDQATFDTDLAALVQAISDLDAAVDAWVGAHPAADFTAEDTSVQAAAAAVAAELAKIAPPAPAPGP